MSQGELARQIECTQREVSDYENVRTFPKPDRIDDIAHALGCAVGDLFAETTTRQRFEGDVLKVALLVERGVQRDPSFAKRALRVLRALIERK